MAEQTENTTRADDTPESAALVPNERQLASVRDFLARHGKPSRAVVENIGRAGARVVLIGHDGALGDVVVAGPAAGERLVEAFDELELSTWDSETVNATAIGPEHRRKMAGMRQL